MLGAQLLARYRRFWLRKGSYSCSGGHLTPVVTNYFPEPHLQEHESEEEAHLFLQCGAKPAFSQLTGFQMANLDMYVACRHQLIGKKKRDARERGIRAFAVLSKTLGPH